MGEKTKMAFYIYEQPAFSMEHFHPRLSQPLRIQSRPRYWNLLENLFEQDSMSLESGQHFCKNKSLEKSEEKSSSSKEQESKSEVEVDKNNEANKAMEPVTKTISKQFMSRVSCQEDMNGVKIKIQFHGHKFKAENWMYKLSMTISYLSKQKMMRKNLKRNSNYLPMLYLTKLNLNLILKKKTCKHLTSIYQRM